MNGVRQGLTRLAFLALLLHLTAHAERRLPSPCAHDDLEACRAALDAAYQRYDVEGALRLAEQALKTAEHSHDLATVAEYEHLVGRLHVELGQTARADPLLTAALTHTTDPVLVGRIQQDLGDLRWDQHRQGEALALYESSFATRAKALGPDASETGMARAHLCTRAIAASQALAARREHEAALALARHMVELATTWGGPEEPTWFELGERAMDSHHPAEARAAYERALAARMVDRERPDSECVRIYMAIGRAARAAGDNDGAVAAFTDALHWSEYWLGSDTGPTASACNELAMARMAQGQLGEASALMQRALDIVEADARLLADFGSAYLNNYGLLLSNMGDPDAACVHYERAIALLEGGDPAELARVVNNLAVARWDAGAVDEAIVQLRRAVALREAALGPVDPLTAGTRYNLGLALWTVGARGEGRAALEAAVAARAASLGADHPDTAYASGALASMAAALGESGAAAQAAAAITRLEATLGPDHLQLAYARERAARMATGRGDIAGAVALLQSSAAAQEHYLQRNLNLGAPAQVRAMLRTEAGLLDQVIDLHLVHAPEDPAAARLALETLLRRKGRALDAEAQSAALAAADPEAATLRAQLITAVSREAGLVQDWPLDPTLARERTAELASIRAEISSLEQAMAIRARSRGALAPSATVAAVAARLPPDAVLVEWAVWHPLDASDPVVPRPGEPRLAAYLLRPDGSVRGVDLGPSAAIDAPVRDLRTTVSSRRPWQQTAEALAHASLGSLEVEVAHAKLPLLSPDGSLSLAPLALLFGEPPRPVVLLGSGRDLLRGADAAKAGAPLVLADIDFGFADADTGPGTMGERGLSWRSLPGTRVEGRAVRDRLPDATLLTGSAATAVALKRVSSPRVLHIATHGYFLEGEPGAAGDTRGVELAADGLGSTIPIADPLLRSGIALAGANDPLVEGEDGLVTAAELARMDLRGTELVVLSACQTGLGETLAGEGVFGLRRALEIAGSDSQLLSLWQVDDRATAAWMIHFYDALATGATRLDAWRTASETVRAHPGWEHPWYWAAFTLSGDWGPLAIY